MQPALLLLTVIIAILLSSVMAITGRPAIGLAPILLVVLGYAALRLPGAVFAAFLYIPFYKGSLQPLLPVDMTPVLAVACLILSLPLLHSSSRIPRAAIALWILLMGLIALGVSYAPDSQLALTQALNFLFLVFAPCLLAFRIAQDERLQLQFLVASAGLSLLVTIVGLAQVGTLGTYDRLAVLGSNTIGTGRAAMLLPLIALSLGRRMPRGARLVLWMAVPLSLLVAFATGSRGPLLAGILAMVFVSLAARGLGKRLIGGLALLLSLWVLSQASAVQEVIPQQSVWRVETLLTAVSSGETSQLDTSSEARLRLFDLASQMYLARPVLGYGTASFEAIANAIPGFDAYKSPHNMFLQFAAEYGSIGIVVAAGLVLLSLARGFVYVRRGYVEPLLALAAFAVFNTIGGGDIVESRWIWGSLLILLAMPMPALRSPHPLPELASKPSRGHVHETENQGRSSQFSS